MCDIYNIDEYSGKIKIFCLRLILMLRHFEFSYYLLDYFEM